MMANERRDEDPVREAVEIPEDDLPGDEFMIPHARDSAWIVEKDGSGNTLPAGHIIHVHSGNLQQGITGDERKPGNPAGAGNGTR